MQPSGQFHPLFSVLVLSSGQHHFRHVFDLRSNNINMCWWDFLMREGSGEWIQVSFGWSWVIGMWAFGEKLDFEMVSCSLWISYKSQGILKGEAEVDLQFWVHETQNLFFRCYLLIIVLFSYEQLLPYLYDNYLIVIALDSPSLQTDNNWIYCRNLWQLNETKRYNFWHNALHDIHMQYM